jgi:hypothetical protein
VVPGEPIGDTRSRLQEGFDEERFAAVSVEHYVPAPA